MDKAKEPASHLRLYSPYASPIGSLKYNQLYNRYYELTGQPFGYYSACAYDIAWIMVQSILEAQSINTKYIVPILSQIAWNNFGVSGWTCLNEAGDRRISDYLIWAYTNKDPSIKVVAEYDGLRDKITWRDIPQVEASIVDAHIQEEENKSNANLHSRKFEDATAEFLRDTHGYDTRVRWKPEYLEGKEIDVFAVKGISPRNITICECKLRLYDRPITLDEVTYFAEKIKIIEAEEGKRGNTTFHNWIVTNVKNYDEDVIQYASDSRVEVRVVELGNNWRKRADWRINKTKKIQK